MLIGAYDKLKKYGVYVDFVIKLKTYNSHELEILYSI